MMRGQPWQGGYRVSPILRAVTVATKRQRPVWQASADRDSPVGLYP